MVKHKEKPTEFIQDWESKIKAGLDYRKRFSTESKWDSFRKMYRGQWDENIVPVNRIFSYGRSLIPRIYFRAPRVVITAMRPDLIWHAKVVEAVDNMLIRETFLKETLKMCGLNSYLCGIGIIKLGYDSEFGYLPEQVVADSGETITQESQTGEGKIEYSTNIRPGMPWAASILPEDIVVPWGSTTSMNLPWIAHRILRPLDDIQQDQKYKNTEDLKGTRIPTFAGVKPQYRPKIERDKDLPFGELWEVRDAKTRSIYTFCEEKLLLSTRDALQFEGLPYEFLMLNPDPQYFWPIPDTSILEPQQLELNEVRTQHAMHRRIALLKFLYKRNAITDAELLKFFSGVVGPGIAVDDDNIASVIHMIQPHVPPELVGEVQLILQDMKEELGFGTNQLGQMTPQHGKTATESMIVEQAFESRIDEKKDLMADLLVNIIRKWNQMLFSFWTEERVIQIVHPEGRPFWISYTGDQLKGEYLLSVDPDSGMPMSKGLKYMMAKEVFQEFNGDPLIDQVLLRKLFLSHYEAVEPLAANLLAVPQGVNPAGLAQERQPYPRGVSGQGQGNRGGGRSGSSPNKPMEFEQAKKKFQGAM